MTPDDVRRFFAEVKTLEQTQGQLNHLYIGDEDFWFECRDKDDREMRSCDQMPPGDGYTIKFYYYYPCDLFETLFVASEYCDAILYLWLDYLRMVRSAKSSQHE